jgi:hypothetical protein
MDDPFGPGAHGFTRFIRPVIIHLDGDKIGLINADQFALGDNLMVTGLLRNLDRPGMEVYSPFPELFENLPLAAKVHRENIPLPDEDRYRLRRDLSRRTIVYPADISQVVLEVDNAAERPLSDMVLNFIEALSIHYQAPRMGDRPWLILTPEERALAEDFLSASRPTLIVAPYKEAEADLSYDLEDEFWGPLVGVFGKFFHVIQLGSDKSLAGVDEFIPQKLPLRQLLALLSGAKAFIGLDGGLSHLMRAFDPGKWIITVYPHFAAFSTWGYRNSCAVVLNADLDGYEQNFHPWDPRFAAGQVVTPAPWSGTDKEGRLAAVYDFIERVFSLDPGIGRTLMMGAAVDASSVTPPPAA